uniref:Putative lipocalin-6 1 n=1 Tax=Amblyomma triste TaxID=251400 RepID=A0A023GB24_AMBTT
MSVAAAFILFVCISKAFAGNEASADKQCSDPERWRDGYTALELNRRFLLKRITFPIQEADTYRCIAVTTIDKDDKGHEVTLTVDYNVQGSTARSDGYSQRFKFFLENGTDHYNIMESDGTIGAPSGSYKFLSADPSCIVLEATQYQLPKDDPVTAEARSEDVVASPETQRQCLLWVREGDESDPDDCCLHMFTEYCPEKEVRQALSSINCRNPAAENAHEEQPQTGSA